MSNGKGSVLKAQIFPPKICLTHAMSVTFKGIFDQYSTLSQSTCESRFRLGLLGLYALEHHNFEQRWKDASMEDRRKHVLIGLSRSCAIARNLNDARMYCGDVLKLGHLSQDAQVLLNFLQISSPKIAPLYQKSPISFPTPFGIVLKLWKKEVEWTSLKRFTWLKLWSWEQSKFVSGQNFRSEKD